MTKQREATFRFLGPNFDDFTKDVENAQEFNRTTTDLINKASTAGNVWLTSWSPGSVISSFRLTYQDGTSATDMDGDIKDIQSNAAQVFGDNLKKFGVVGIEVMGIPSSPPADDDDDKSLAIGLGVGLGVGIPLVAGVIFYCIWSRRRQQVVTPGEASS